MSRKQEKQGCIVLADNQPHVRMSEKALALLAESSEVIKLEFGYSEEELLRSLRRADVVISIMAPISREMMDVAPRLKGIRTDRHKYVIDRRNDDAEEFYDLANDPGEKTNVIDILDGEEQLVAKQMREQVDLFYGAGERKSALSKEEEEKIRSRLRDLHYID